MSNRRSAMFSATRGVRYDPSRRTAGGGKKGHPWEIGKSFDQSAPCGPIFPVAQVGHLQEGEIEIAVNGQVRQHSDLNQMIWDVPNIISQLSQQVTLQPGDLIYTGTPEGVGPVVSGDVMVGRIANLGELTIKVT